MNNDDYEEMRNAAVMDEVVTMSQEMISLKDKVQDFERFVIQIHHVLYKENGRTASEAIDAIKELYLEKAS